MSPHRAPDPRRHEARLCLDCEEVHDAQRCPACASETFAVLSRWVPVPDRPPEARPPDTGPPVVRERAHAPGSRAKGRVLTGSLLGITTLGVVSWLIGRRDSSRT
jgi:hypothetical protein